MFDDVTVRQFFADRVVCFVFAGVQASGGEELVVVGNCSGILARPTAGLPVGPFNPPTVPGNHDALTHCWVCVCV